MADLVLGLAKSAVEETLTIANSAIEQEKKLQKSVKCNLILILDEFEMMHSFLNVAKDNITNDMERTLVWQVRNMALDVEDCIESVVLLDNKSSWWRHLLPSCLPPAAPVAALEDAIAGMELLKARVDAMGKRNNLYNQNGGSSSKSCERVHRQAFINATAWDILVQARENKDQSSQFDLHNLICKEINDVLELQVISVWGTSSSAGMASILKEAYDKPEICEKFGRRAWVKLKHPFDPHEFIRSLLFQFYSNICLQEGSAVGILNPMDVVEATKGKLIKEFKRHVNNQRFLVILEDMSTMDDWNTIRAYLPDQNNGSCIILQTQQLKIASLCIGHSYQVLELKRFSDDHSVCAFFLEDKEEYVKTTKQTAARIWLDKFQTVRIGREIDLNIFHRMAVQPAKREVLFVWGIAGVGKTSVVKHVYCSLVLQEGHNFENFGWVNVPHPFNLRDLSWSLLLDLHSDCQQYHNMLKIKDSIKACLDILHEHRCLVVIDGIESVEDWYLTKAALEIGRSQSRIIVITNEEKVATHCAMQRNSTFNIKVLEVDECLDLFKKKIQENRVADVPLAFSPETGQLMTIIHKCGGLPRVVVAISDFFWGLGSEEWKMLSDRFMHELEINQSLCNLQGLFFWVHSYFRTCPDFLKPCIFYLSIFPLDHIIRRRRLVRRWIAEGYSRDTKESTAEENTEDSFSKLVKLSMLQLHGSTTAMDFYGKMSMCQVNGFFREYILSRPMEENLVFSLEGRCRINSQRTGRHLAIGSSWDRDRNVYRSIDLSRLRSLTVFGEWQSFFISDKMELLRVLDLEDTLGVANEDVAQMVKYLPRLKFLSLRRCRNISCLPHSLGRLRQLQSLDIRDTLVTRLPKSVIKIQKLQYIRAGITVALDDDTSMVQTLSKTAGTLPSSILPMSRLLLRTRRHLAGSCNGGVEAPRRIGQLTALHTLGVIDISVIMGRAVLADLKNLTQLHKLGVSGVNQSTSQEFFSAISDHGHLESLSLQLDENNQDCLDCTSSPPDNLRSLKLFGQVHKLPTWIRHLGNLRKLNLQMETMLPQDEIDVLGHLPKLAILFLCFKVFPAGELQFGKHFSQLRLLEIGCTSGLQAVSFSASGFPTLEALKLHCYSVLSLQFFGLEHLGVLKEVWLGECHNEAFKQNMRNLLARLRPNEIQPVLRLIPNSAAAGNAAGSGSR